MVNDVVTELVGSMDKAMEAFKRDLGKSAPAGQHLHARRGEVGIRHPHALNQIATLNVPDPGSSPSSRGETIIRPSRRRSSRTRSSA